MRIDILEHKEDILKWIAEEQPKSYICQQLHCKPSTLNSYLKKMGIEYKGQQDWRKGKIDRSRYVTAEEYIKKNCVKSSRLKQKLIYEGYKENKCELCGVLIWQGIELPLELHHIDGNHFNNNLDNLQILCPNCHSIQENNAGKNIGKYLTHQKNYCIDCGKEISNKSIRCEDCYHKSTKGVFKITLDNMPITREELKKLIRTTPFVKIAKDYGVSDKAIVKWCIKFNLPSRKKDINIISDEEWKKI